MSWLHILQADPYRGATQAKKWGPEWWFAQIPETDTGKEVTTCLYRVLDREQQAIVSLISTLPLPLYDDDSF